MAAKRADPTTHLAVDTAILTYLLHSSTLTLLRAPPPLGPAPTRNHELPLQMVDSFLTLFHTAHPSAAHPPPLHLRLLILRFTALFTLRHSPCTSTPSPNALAALRRTHAARAAAFLAAQDPAAGCDLRAYACPALASASERPPPQLSLLDTLPLFVDLAARAAVLHGEPIAHRGRALVGRYMAAATVEAYLVCGAEGPGALREAFAWGAEGEGGMWGEGWEAERGEGVRMLIPPEGLGLGEWLGEVEGSRGVRGVEEDVRAFLGGLVSAEEVPVLVSEERGELGEEGWGDDGDVGG
ncbi:hypothetical protein MMC27_001932 [Xylographa pallens]|nr:hypothetical protein [Xylographa pallens]